MTAEGGPEPAFRRIDERVVHEGHLWRVAVADFEGPGGERFVRDVVRSPGSVGVVPVLFDAEGNASVVLVRQYRPVLDRWLLEIPAGMRDVEGEPPEDTAQRELREEAGYEAGHLVRLTAFEPSGGMTDSVCTVFVATHLRPVPHQPHGPEEEAMQREVLPFGEAVARAVAGELTDAKTVIGLLLAERHLSLGDGTAR